MRDIECKINLIMFNPHKGTQFIASDMQQVEAFRAIIMQVCFPSITPVLVGLLVYHYLGVMFSISCEHSMCEAGGLIQHLPACLTSFVTKQAGMCAQAINIPRPGSPEPYHKLS